MFQNLESLYEQAVGLHGKEAADAAAEESVAAWNAAALAGADPEVCEREQRLAFASWFEHYR